MLAALNTGDRRRRHTQRLRGGTEAETIALAFGTHAGSQDGAIDTSWRFGKLRVVAHGSGSLTTLLRERSTAPRVTQAARLRTATVLHWRSASSATSRTSVRPMRDLLCSNRKESSRELEQAEVDGAHRGDRREHPDDRGVALAAQDEPRQRHLGQAEDHRGRARLLGGGQRGGPHLRAAGSERQGPHSHRCGPFTCGSANSGVS